MVRAESGKKETMVIVNRRTAMFVTWPKDVSWLVLVIRDGPTAQNIIVPHYNGGPHLTSEFLEARMERVNDQRNTCWITAPGCTGWIIDQLPVAS